MILFIFLAIMFAAAGLIAWVVTIAQGPRPIEFQVEALLGGFAMTAAALTFFIAMDHAEWILPCPLLLCVATGAFGWLERTYPVMLKLCLVGAFIAVAGCLWQFYRYFDRPTHSGSVEITQQLLCFTFGISGLLGCAVIILKIIGPATARYLEGDSRRPSASRRSLEHRAARVRGAVEIEASDEPPTVA